MRSPCMLMFHYFFHFSIIIHQFPYFSYWNGPHHACSNGFCQAMASARLEVVIGATARTGAAEHFHNSVMQCNGDRSIIWLVVWNIFYFPIYWVANHPNWLSYFSEGWPNHQPEILRCTLLSDESKSAAGWRLCSTDGHFWSLFDGKKRSHPLLATTIFIGLSTVTYGWTPFPDVMVFQHENVP